jgi:hypothetical protein
MCQAHNKPPQCPESHPAGGVAIIWVLSTPQHCGIGVMSLLQIHMLSDSRNLNPGLTQGQILKPKTSRFPTGKKILPFSVRKQE